MKSYLILLFTFISSTIYCQNEYLIGTYSRFPDEVFTQLDFNTRTYNNIDTLKGAYYHQYGSNAIDPINHRYFCITNFGFTILDLYTGHIIDTFPLSDPIDDMDYDPITEKIYGHHWGGNFDNYLSLDLTTHKVDTIKALNGFFEVTVGFHAIDIFKRRYFLHSDNGILMVDLDGGKVLKIIPNPENLMFLEYDFTTDRIYGSYWTGPSTMLRIFSYLDLSDYTYHVVDTIPEIRNVADVHTAFDPRKGMYYCIIKQKTGQWAVAKVDVNQGTLVDTIDCEPYFRGIEIITCDPVAKRADSACFEFILPGSGGKVTNSGVYVDYVGISALCDSIILYDLDIVEIDLSINTLYKSVKVNQKSAIYQWLDCGNNMDTIGGWSSPAFIFKNTSEYVACEITYKGCVDTTDCFNWQPGGISDNIEDAQFSAYPNPTTSTVHLKSIKNYEFLQVKVVSLLGKTVQKLTLTNVIGFSFELEGNSGLYFLEITSPDGNSSTFRLIKQ